MPKNAKLLTLITFQYFVGIHASVLSVCHYITNLEISKQVRVLIILNQNIVEIMTIKVLVSNEPNFA